MIDVKTSRIKVVVIAVVLLAVIAGVAIAVDSWQGDSSINTISEHDTDDDFDGAHLDNLTVEDGTVKLDRWATYNKQYTYSVSDNVRGVYVDDGEGFAATGTGAGSGYGLYKIDLATGTEEWRFDNDDWFDAVYVEDDVVYGGTVGGDLIAIDRETGAEKWRYSGERIDDITGDGQYIYATDDDEVIKLNSDTQAVEWNYTGHNTIVQSLDYHNGYVVSGDFDGNLHRIDDSGNNDWENSDHSGELQGIVISGDSIFTASHDETVRKFEFATGNSVWTNNDNNDNVKDVWYNDGVVFSAGDDGTIRTINEETGDQIWFEDVGDRLFGISSDDNWLMSGDFSLDKLYVSKVVDSGKYTSDSHNLSDPYEGAVNMDLVNSESTIEWQGYDSGWETITEESVTESGIVTSNLEGSSYSEYRVVVEFVQSEQTSTWDSSLTSDSVTFESTAPKISNPNPADGGYTNDSSTVELGVDVSDPDFDTEQGDKVNVEFYDASDDSLIDSVTLTENDTASVNWDTPYLGTNKWYVIAEDDYGATTETSVISFDTPHELEVRNETDPNSLVDENVEVKIRFFGSDDIITKTTTDGIVDMSGLPAEELVVQTEADGYHTRQTIIPSIFKQQTVYALPETTDTVSTRFVLDDATGEFTGEQTRVFVQKPITQDGETDYEVVVADEIGSGGYTTRLEQGQRYLIEVENVETGQTRNLGPYVASESETVTLDVGTLEFSFEDEDVGYRWHAEYVNVSEDETAIDFVFESTDQEIDELQWTITERGGDEEVIADEIELGTTFVNERYFVDDDDNITTYVVEWQATIGDEEIEGSTIVGPDQVPVGIPGVPDEVLHVVTVLLIFLVAGLFSAANVHIGAIVVSLLAGVFWFIGMLPGGVSGILIALALFISVIHMAHTKASAGGVPR